MFWRKGKKKTRPLKFKLATYLTEQKHFHSSKETTVNKVQIHGMWSVWIKQKVIKWSNLWRKLTHSTIYMSILILANFMTICIAFLFNFLSQLLQIKIQHTDVYIFGYKIFKRRGEITMKRIKNVHYIAKKKKLLPLDPTFNFICMQKCLAEKK